MKVGNLVSYLGHTAVIIKLSEPTLQFPYQIATILLNDGTLKERVTTTLKKL